VAIQTLQSNLRNPGQHLAREILCTANRIQKRKGKKCCKLTIRWTAGHKGVKGNEKADEGAKKAAKGSSSDKPSLPHYLHCPLLINPSALKQSRATKLKEIWSEKWCKSTRGNILMKLDKSTPSNGFIKRLSTSNLSRNSASLILQLAITHVPLNTHLKRFQRADSANCPACGARNKMVEHFLLACPSYARERWKLRSEALKLSKNMCIETLLGDLDLTLPLANFIDTTHWFKPIAKPDMPRCSTP